MQTAILVFVCIAAVCRRLLRSLSDAEYAYLVQHGGEGYPERAYGVRCER